jgi:uncharacterized membrane protein required for colicin V production
MGGNFWWIFDAVVVVSAVLCVIHCAGKGFSKIIVTAIGCVASFAIAWMISKSAADMVYEKVFMKGNIEAVRIATEDYNPEDVIKMIIENNELSGVLSNEKIKNILEGEDSLEKLYNYANSEASNILDTKDGFEKNIINEFAKVFSSQVGANLPPYVAEGILSNISGNKEMFLSTVDMIMTNSDRLPEHIEENYIRKPAKRIVSATIFLIVFFVLMTIIILVANKSGKFGLLNGYDRLDKFAGGVLGCIEAISIIMIFAFIVKIIINISSDNNSFINVNTIEKTLLFKHFYKFL